MSFGPELKNGDPLSQDNFLANFRADSAVVGSGWWWVVLGVSSLYPGVVWTVVSPYNLIISSVYVQTSFGAKSPRPSFYQIF